MRIRPLAGRITFLRAKWPEKSIGGIYIPATYSDTSNEGEVLAVAPDVTLVKPGDRILIGRVCLMEYGVYDEAGKKTTISIASEKSVFAVFRDGTWVPTLARAIVLKNKAEKDSHGLIIPVRKQECVNRDGFVVAVGPEVEQFGVGAHVVYGVCAGVEVQIDEKFYLVIDERDVVSVMED